MSTVFANKSLQMLRNLHVMGDYWMPDGSGRTALGELVRATKDRGEAEAARRLERQLAAYTRTLGISNGPRAGGIVVAVPSAPGTGRHPVPGLARAAGEVLGLSVVAAVGRAHVSARLRGSAPEERRGLVIDAGYSVTASVAGLDVLLVDDVILTGTTLEYLAELLTDAGARSVDAVVAARTRLS